MPRGAKLSLEEKRKRQNERSRRWRSANRERRLEFEARYREDNREKLRAAARESKRRTRAADPEAAREIMRRWKAANPERATELHRAWQAENRERTREIARAWYWANREQALAAAKKKRQANPDKVRLAGLKRRALKVSAGSPGVTVKQWRELCSRHTDADGRICCAYCKEPCKPTVDHLVPLAKGGRDEIANILPACIGCNTSKNASLIFEWHKARKLLSAEELERLTKLSHDLHRHDMA